MPSGLNVEPGDDPAALLAVARVDAAHGVKGQVICTLLTDFPDRFARTESVLVGIPPVERVLERQRLHGDRVILKLAGVDNRAAAEQLRGVTVYVPVTAAVELPEGQYFWHQIVGLCVTTEDGRQLGRVAEVLRTGSNDVYIVRAKGRELLLPAISDVIRTVDLERGIMTVTLIPGLED